MSTESAPLADRVKVIEAVYGGEFERQPQDDGTVTVRVRRSTGEVMAGNGATTLDAVTELETRVNAFITALGGSI